MRAPCALGRLDPNGPWIGFVLEPGSPLLAVGLTDGSLRSAAAGAREIVSAAIAYFAELFPDPPQELEATHADVAELVRSLVADEPDAERRGLLMEAVDAIDDGLASDAVVGRLMVAQQQVDPAEAAEVLRSAARSLLELPPGQAG
jgi:hypothetical protein